MTTLSKRLKEAREEIGLTQGQLAKAAGLKNQSIIGALESGARKTSSHIPSIAAVCNVTALWLSKGTGQKYESESKSHPPVTLLARPIIVYDTLDELPSETTVLITQIDLDVSAGNGRENYEIIEKPPLPFQADYIRGIKASPKHLLAVKVVGRSMEPLLFDGDTVVIDKQDKRPPVNGGVFVVVYGEEMMVKRLFRLPNGIKVSSDNEAEGPRFELHDERMNDIDIVGRVKYRSGRGNF